MLLRDFLIANAMNSQFSVKNSRVSSVSGSQVEEDSLINRTSTERAKIITSYEILCIHISNTSTYAYVSGIIKSSGPCR